MSTWQAINTWVTITLAVVVVLVLATTLLLTLVALQRARRHASRLAEGLEGVQANTASVPTQLPAINGALTQLLAGLESVDAHLGGAAAAFGLR